MTVLVFGCAGSIPTIATPTPYSLLHQTLNVSSELSETDRAIELLYRQNNYQPLWITSLSLSPRALLIINALAESYNEGLDPQDYLVDEINLLRNSSELSDQTHLDLSVTTGLARYLKDSLSGRLTPCLVDPRLFPNAGKERIDLLHLLRKALTTSDPTLFLGAVHPAHQDYTLLRQALKRYRNIALSGGWESVPNGPSIKPGMTDSRLPQVIRRLQTSGDLPPRISTTSLYTEEIVYGIQQFQERFNLEVDGIIGKQTLKALNTPVLDLINRILINMERWRWLPRTSTGRHIMVNIAGFRLTAFENQSPVLTMPVIVGTTYNETPVFSERMRYLVFNPYWNIPEKIAANEILPLQINNPSYLEENGIKLFEGWDENSTAIDPTTVDWVAIRRNIKSYRLRQEPGGGNPLGRLKFIFPNGYHVYLHDTPAKDLFNHSRRAFSHGCIRISDPLALARFLLKENRPSWDRELIEQHVSNGKRKIVVLDTPVPVHILYRTVYVAPESGRVFFYPDIYKRDARLISSLLTPRDKTLCLH